ncbi:MAG: hypothetical protein ACLRMJ_07650 [Alistipes finegoldii]
MDFADEEAALAAQDAGLEPEGETAEEAEAEQMAGSAADTEDKFTGGARRSWWLYSRACSKSSPCSRSAGMWRR